MSDNGHRRTISVNWAGLGDEDDDDRFFESCDRLSSVVAVDLASSGSSSDEDEEFEDPRMSFASAISSVGEDYRCLSGTRASTSSPIASVSREDYNVWMAEPGSINERRKRLFHGMGFGLSDKQLLRLASAELQRAVSNKFGGNCQVSPLIVERTQGGEALKRDQSSSSPLPPAILVRSRSDGDIDFPSVAKRKEEFFSNTSKQRLARTSTNLLGVCTRACRLPDPVRVSPKEGTTAPPFRHKGSLSSVLSNSRFGAIFLIKNLDTGKEFIVNEYDNEGMWNRLSDLQTGKQLTMDEFEKSVGYSPVVKELMRRENVSRMANGGIGASERKYNTNSYLSKSLRLSKRSGVALLKNIKGVANSMSGLIGDRERESQPFPDQKPGKSASPTPSSEWVRVRQHGKSYRELSALQLCQEIQAHEGSIWTIRFSLDAHYLASAGEDRVIHVWEVQECELMSMRPDEWSWTPLHPSASASACNTPDRYEGSGMMCSPGPLSPAPSERKKKGKGSQNKKGIPDYVYVPETVFGLSERPVCSFKGHLDDVLDLSWSRSQLLLSSSMDKTVRLWDLDTMSCLKLFAHNDYVTCIQFNPIDDRYFISGSLDSKVRIWNIPDRQVVDWTDIHEMVTAVCYTPDGEGAIIGSHKGSCRVYSAEDCKLTQTSQVEISNKKKSHAKKITGFQFSPWNPSEVLITSADSRIRILDGSDVTHKFRGFRNTSSQIAASFTQDGKYIVCASEDSHVYVWKHQEAHHGKTKGVVNVRSYEQFQCKDVSVAIPWPGTIRGEPPPMTVHSKRHSKRSTTPPPPASSAGSPTQEERENLHPGPIGASKRQLPPLPKKANAIDRASTPPEEEMAQLSRLDSGMGIGDSFNSAASSSIRYCSDSPSISAAANPSTASWSSSWSWFDGGNSNGTVQATAWGMVIVTAGLGGEIRAYQNFGLPRRAGRQANLF
ncbi:WD repeat-containing protein 44 [Punica granatum]|uniref:WD repeat-containing protein 44 n=1 Tax=Punica granatum TaxID=22663 RepID=A0A218XBJ3_PUNGR|nr:WD repeat-containing protein 44 [Punica granatum]OWM82313.1 hypothetical protein CDL15_Pgr001887 [Punica granatum]